jgi:peptidoglycan/xylan/chitin deacetylase (PgdA/CDA1 family)
MREQRRPQAVLARHLARIERLYRESAVEAGSAGRRSGDPAECGDAHRRRLGRASARPGRDDSNMRPLLALAPVVPRIAASAGIPLRLDRPQPTLTFDDGPHPDGTPRVLDLIDAAGTKAIFFVTGEQFERWPEIGAEIESRGHELAIHGYRHHVQVRLSRAAVEADLRKAIEVIGARRFHRPPLGIYSDAGLAAVRERGMQPLLWSRWGKDWRKFTTPQRIAVRATRRLGPGDVILLHDSDHYSSKHSWQRTVAALPEILAALQPTGSGSTSTDGAAVSQPK